MHDSPGGDGAGGRGGQRRLERPDGGKGRGLDFSLRVDPSCCSALRQHKARQRSTRRKTSGDDHDQTHTGAPSVTRPTTALRRSIERAAEAGMDRFVTQREAADLARCSKDTIVRTRQAGRLPHARLDGHRWMIPIADLVVAGIYDPAAGAMPGALSAAPEQPGDPCAAPVSMDLARAQARIAALEDLVARQDGELAFLRQLATDTLSRKAS